MQLEIDLERLRALPAPRAARRARPSRASRRSGCGPRDATLARRDNHGAMRRTKIVATVGPATADPTGACERCSTPGVDVVRLNAAHGDPAECTPNARSSARAIAADARPRRSACSSTCPARRCAPVRSRDDEVELHAGPPVHADRGDRRGRRAPRVDHRSRARAMGARRRRGVPRRRRDRAGASNGSTATTCVCEVVRGGVLRSRKGMHVPRAEAHVEPFTDADAVALTMAVRIKADFVGLSFVRRPEDVEAVRARLPKRGARPQLVAEDRDRGRARSPRRASSRRPTR